MQTTELKAVKGNGSLPPTKFGVQLTAYEAIDILQLIDGIKKANKVINGSLMKRFVKNEKFLKVILTTHGVKEDEVIDKYCEKDEAGNVLWWDGHDEEVKNDKGEITSGEKAIYNRESGFLIGVTSKKAMNPRMYSQWVKDEKLREEYYEHNKTLSEFVYEADMYKFTDKELDNVAIPTQNPQTTQPMKPETFYNKLVLEETEK